MLMSPSGGAIEGMLGGGAYAAKVLTVSEAKDWTALTVLAKKVIDMKVKKGHRYEG